MPFAQERADRGGGSEGVPVRTGWETWTDGSRSTRGHAGGQVQGGGGGQAGIGVALVLVGRSGQGETDGGSQVGDEGQAGEEPARPELPEMVPASPEHDQSARCTTSRSSPGIYCRVVGARGEGFSRF